MNDMSQVIIPKSDQINADDLIAGPLTIRITDVAISPGTEQPVTISYEGDDGRPWKPCKTMSRLLVTAWGADAKKYIGRSVTLYRDPNVKWGGLAVGGIRVSHMTDIPPEKISNGKMVVQLTETRGKRSPVTVQPLTAETRADAAQTWADGFKSQVAAATDLPTLENFVAGKAAKLDELKGKRPELHAECEAAVAARKAALAPSGDDSTDGVQDDGFSADKPDLSGFVTGLENRIAGATTLEQLDEIAEDLNGQSDDLPEDQVGELDRQIAAARRRIGKGG